MEEINKKANPIKTDLYILGGVIILFVMALFYGLSSIGNFMEKLDEKKERKAFQEGREFICLDGIFGHPNATIISKKSGWEYGKKYYKKDTRLINKKSCHRKEASSP